MNKTALISRRGVLAAAAIAAVIPLVAGCTAGGGNTASGPTTITVMAGAQDLTPELIADFESKNPNIKVNHILTDPARLNTMLAAGNPPDIATGGAVGSANINARGLATDLTPFLEKSTVLKEDDLQPVNDSFRWDGKQSGKGPLYGIVKDWSGDNTLWYNTALFDKAGVAHLSETEPVTYDQLLTIAKQLTVKDGGTTAVHGLGVEWGWSLYGPISAMIMQQGGKLYNDDLTKIDFNSAEAKRAIQWYVDFGKAGVGPTSLNPLPDLADFSTFAAGRMAISQDGYWFGGNFAAPDAIKTIKMAPAPVMGDTPVVPSYSGQGWWMPEQAKNKDAAWKLMEYFMAGPPAETRAKSGWGLPALKSLSEKLPQDLPYQQNAYKVAQNELKHSVVLPDSPYITTDLVNTTIDKYLQQAIKGELTVEKACASITDEINKVLEQGKEQIG
ncbi:ABC transporter substrate-binding protein [Paenarthrobacter aromaticivorans]|uniref:Sugar ABC transporter substrate-binding protein n=1 Tax=Paenarthrobacter aromaticivorans TaxID=2849150 RepID=A0ABS6I7M5_9MICC|nr:sugar ABC transporter substrate-binding protein [Paenarthrobacter sp. MMS21-TAE1-1]MBU8867725.1 sugar ABC transporter substrate-binding protein [Paenarthrobacter sp. MMS21-TAE1-1]